MKQVKIMDRIGHKTIKKFEAETMQQAIDKAKAELKDWMNPKDRRELANHTTGRGMPYSIIYQFG